MLTFRSLEFISKIFLIFNYFNWSNYKEILNEMYTLFLISNLINNMDHMDISDIEPSSVILSQTKEFQKVEKRCQKSAKTIWNQSG